MAGQQKIEGKSDGKQKVDNKVFEGLPHSDNQERKSQSKSKQDDSESLKPSFNVELQSKDGQLCVLQFHLKQTHLDIMLFSVSDPLQVYSSAFCYDALPENVQNFYGSLSDFYEYLYFVKGESMSVKDNNILVVKYGWKKQLQLFLEPQPRKELEKQSSERRKQMQLGNMIDIRKNKFQGLNFFAELKEKCDNLEKQNLRLKESHSVLEAQIKLKDQKNRECLNQLNRLTKELQDAHKNLEVVQEQRSKSRILREEKLILENQLKQKIGMLESETQKSKDLQFEVQILQKAIQNSKEAQRPSHQSQSLTFSKTQSVPTNTYQSQSDIFSQNQTQIFSQALPTPTFQNTPNPYSTQECTPQSDNSSTSYFGKAFNNLLSKVMPSQSTPKDHLQTQNSTPGNSQSFKRANPFANLFSSHSSMMTNGLKRRQDSRFFAFIKQNQNSSYRCLDLGLKDITNTDIDELISYDWSDIHILNLSSNTIEGDGLAKILRSNRFGSLKRILMCKYRLMSFIGKNRVHVFQANYYHKPLMPDLQLIDLNQNPLSRQSKQQIVSLMRWNPQLKVQYQ